MPVNVGRFIISVSGEADGLKLTFKEVEEESKGFLSNLRGVRDTLGQIFSGAGVVTAGLVGGIVLLRRELESIQELDNFARTVDASVESIQRLEFAASRIGLAPDQVRDAILDINERVSEAATLGTGEAAEVLGFLQIDADDLLAQDTITRFQILGDAIADVENSATRVQLIRQLASDSATPLLNLFADSNFEIERATELLDEYNLLLSEADIQNVRDANAAFAELDAIISGITQQLATEFLPEINLGIRQAGELLNRVTQDPASLLSVQSLVNFRQIATDITIDALDAQAEARQQQERLNEQKRIEADLQREIADQQREAAADAREAERATAAALRERQSLERRGETFTDSLRTESEIYADTISELRNLLDEGVISDETFNRGLVQAATALDSATNNFAGRIADLQRELEDDSPIAVLERRLNNLADLQAAGADPQLINRAASRFAQDFRDAERAARNINDLVTNEFRTGSGASRAAFLENRERGRLDQGTEQQLDRVWQRAIDRLAEKLNQRDQNLIDRITTATATGGEIRVTPIEILPGP